MNGKDYVMVARVYDEGIKAVVPMLSSNVAQITLGLINKDIEGQRPVEQSMSMEPRVILGETLDGDIIYGAGGSTIQGTYHLAEYDELHKSISEMVRREERLGGEPASGLDERTRFDLSCSYDASLRDKKELLESLVALKE
jgi:hypothetical protein